MARVTFGLAVVLSLLGAGCADLQPISVDVCGNGVAEPARGEDCDGNAPMGATCGAPATPHACRYVCQMQTDCPADFSCGLDGLCRASPSSWAAAPAVMPRSTEAPLDLVIADSDRDGLGDVFEEAASAVTVHYDVTSSTQSELSVARDSILPAIGPIADLSGDGLADAVIPADLGYFVSLGNPTRVELATAYGAVQLPKDVTDVQALSADVLPDLPGTEILVLTVLSLPGEKPAPVLVNVGTTGALSFIGKLPDAPSKLAGPVRAGRLDEDATVVPCDELVLGYEGKSSVDLLVPCAIVGGDVMLAQNVTTTPVMLPKGSTVAGDVTVEDLDHDGHLDLVVVATGGKGYEIDVAYGRGDGNFDSQPGATNAASPDGSAGTQVHVGQSLPPLAVFDLDGDGHPDWIDATGIYLSRSGDPVIAAYDHDAPWTTALVAHIDGDTLPDVAVGSKQAPGLTVFLNAGNGVFTGIPVETRGNVTLLGAGDFDGDHVGDLAAVTTATNTDAATSSGATSDTLSVLFGSAVGAPAAPREIGEFVHVEQLATARVTSGVPEVLDAADELGALAKADDGTLAFAIIFGQGNRDLRCPYDLARTNLSEADVKGYAPLRITTGDVDGDGTLDVVSLGQRIDDQSDDRIWANPMRGNASIRLGDSTFSGALAGAFDWEHVLFGAVDLDGAPGDEVVVLGPRADGSGSLSAVAHAASIAGGPRTYAMANPVDAELTFTRTEKLLSDPTARNGRLRVDDLDGDGARDVVALGQRSGRGEVVVYFNDSSGTLGQATTISDAGTLDVLDFALLRAPGDTKPRILMLTTTGVFLVTARGRALTVGGAPALSMTAGTPTSPRLIATGDVDGDGVQDLALGGPLGFEVHLGLSVNAADAR